MFGFLALRYQLLEQPDKRGEAVMELLRQLNKEGSTICMVTHDARYEVEAGRVVHLVDGQTLTS